jgi:Mg2+/citrate symporter
MNIWSSLIGVAILLYAVNVIYKGRISMTDDANSRSYYVRRSEKPVLFWLNVLIMLALATVLIFNIFHF